MRCVPSCVRVATPSLSASVSVGTPPMGRHRAAPIDPSTREPRDVGDHLAIARVAGGVGVPDHLPARGDSATGVTERVYRHQLHTVLDEGATAMHDGFPLGDAGQSLG